MSYNRGGNRSGRRKLSCVSVPVLAGVCLLLLIEGYTLWVRPQISAYIGRQVGQQMGLPTPAPAMPAGLPPPTSSSAPASGGQNTIPAQDENALQPAVATSPAAPPPSTITITEQQANAYLAANIAALHPIESLDIQFRPGEAQSDITVFGTQMSIRSAIGVENGQIRVVNPHLDGALGMFVSIEDVVRPLEQQLNAYLQAQEQTIQDIQIEQGQVVVLIRPM